MTRFSITFKREKWYVKRRTLQIVGDNYFISENDSDGVSRFVIFKNTPHGKDHVFCTDMNNVLYFLMYPEILGDED